MNLYIDSNNRKNDSLVNPGKKTVVANVVIFGKNQTYDISQSYHKKRYNPHRYKGKGSKSFQLIESICDRRLTDALELLGEFGLGGDFALVMLNRLGGVCNA